MALSGKALLRLMIPAGLLGLAVWLRPLLEDLDARQLELLAVMPYLLPGISFLFAYQFNRSRFMLLALLTAASYWLIQTRLQVSLQDDAEAAQHFLLLSSAVPLGTALLLLVPERGVFNRHGMAYLLLLIVVAGVGAAMAKNLPQWLAAYPNWFELWPWPGYVLSRVGTALFSVVLLVGAVQLYRIRSEAEATLVGTLLSIYLVLAGFHLPHVSVVLFCTAGAIQLAGILRSSRDMAYRDELTGLLGRRALNERLRGLGGQYALAMLDVDHFKKFNDSHGHVVGDEVLKLVASRLGSVGAGGTAYRYGGEEFCIVFPRRDAAACVDALQAVRESIAAYHMAIRDRDQRPRRKKQGAQLRDKMATRQNPGTVSVTVSLGLAERNEKASSPEEVVRAADKKLYKAKQAGRNRLVC
jgi:diguanylate cyclase (GGDEF)-like protein